VILVTLTGGIGSGKSSVSARLQERGAVVVDADAVTKELQAPGGSVFAAMVERWGQGIVGADGTLNRQAVADIAFNDPAELKALNKMVHPAVIAEMNRRAAAEADTGRVVVIDTPLFVERPAASRAPHSGLIVVDAPHEIAVERLVKYRGFSEVDAWNRVTSQASREDRVAAADFVVDNSGTPEQLDAEVERLWAWIATLDEVAPPPVRPSK
jgi:dephospho-CoA kinase